MLRNSNTELGFFGFFNRPHATNTYLIRPILLDTKKLIG